MGAPLAVWQQVIGDGFDAIGQALAPTDRIASRWPGEQPHFPWRRVVDHRNGTFAAVCDDELSPRLELRRESLVMHRVQERRLREMLCAAFEFVTSRDALRPLPGVLRIGSWKPKPAAQFPVVLAVATTPAQLAEFIVASGDGPTIMLTPTRAMWSARSEAVAGPAKVTLVPLDEVLEWSDAGWIPTSSWDDYLGAFVQRAGIKLPPGFSTIRKKMRTSKASATAGKIKAELKAWYGPARNALLESGTLLPAPELKDIAKACGIDQSTVSRWLNGRYRENDKELMLLWQNIQDPESVRNFHS